MQYLDAISEMTEWSIHFQGKSFNITVIQVNAQISNAQEDEVEWFYEDLQELLEWTRKKDVLFIIGGWHAKVGSQETSGLTGKFGLGVHNEAGKRLIEFCQENTLVIAKPSSNNTREDSIHGQHQTINTKVRLITFFAVKHEEALYSQQKQDLTVAQIMNSLFPNSDLNWRKKGKPLDNSGMT